MTGDCHVRFCEGLVGKFHRPTLQVNNSPLTHCGKVSVDPRLDFNGRKEFTVSIPTYPGSSGSPLYYKQDNKILFAGMTRGGPPSESGRAQRLANKRLSEGINQLEKRQKMMSDLQEAQSDQIDNLQEELRDLPGQENSLELSESKAAVDLDDLHRNQFSNTAYVIKPSVVRRCIISAYLNRSNIMFSNIECFICDDLQVLKKGNLEKLKKSNLFTLPDRFRNYQTSVDTKKLTHVDAYKIEDL